MIIFTVTLYCLSIEKVLEMEDVAKEDVGSRGDIISLASRKGFILFCFIQALQPDGIRVFQVTLLLAQVAFCTSRALCRRRRNFLCVVNISVPCKILQTRCKTGSKITLGRNLC